MAVGPASKGKSHLAVALGGAAIEAGLRVRYFTGVELVESLYRACPTSASAASSRRSCARTCSSSTSSCFAPLDAVGSHALFRFVAAAYERRSLAVASHWPFEEWGALPPRDRRRHLAAQPAAAPRDRVVNAGESFRMREARSRAAPRAKAAAKGS